MNDSYLVSPNNTTQTITIKSARDNDENKLICCSIALECTKVLLKIGGFVCAVVYIVYSILALVNDKPICDACPNSHLWEYMLTAVILFVLSKWQQKNVFTEESDKINPCTIICSLGCTMILEMCLGIWGYTELFKNPYIIHNTTNINSTDINSTDINSTYFNNTIIESRLIECPGIRGSQIWTLGLITAVLQFITTAICFAGVLGFICYVFWCK